MIHRLHRSEATSDDKGLANGDELIASFEDNAIVLRTYDEAMQRLQDSFCSGLDPNVSLVDELLEERRQDAGLEAGR